MPSLKALLNRKKSVKATQKITSAMKVVAAAKLRRSQEQLTSTHHYSDELAKIMRVVLHTLNPFEVDRLMLQGLQINGGKTGFSKGTGTMEGHLLIVVGSDRGLCGNFNGALAREARHKIHSLTREGKSVKLIFVGRKIRELLKGEFSGLIAHELVDVSKPRIEFSSAVTLTDWVLEGLKQSECSTASILYSPFISVMKQQVTELSLVPLDVLASASGSETAKAKPQAIYDYEHKVEKIFVDLLPVYLQTKIYQALLQTQASEHGARMMAMENATRNANDMIKRLDLQYNRTRQAYITKELIEIISGAEAL